MNYLAHLALSTEDPNIMMGNFIADNIPRKEEALVTSEVLAGIKLHRKIDTVTDDHAAFKSGVKRLRPYHGKYAPVVLDILNDHILARNWSKYFTRSRSEFDELVYDALGTGVKALPPKVSLHVQVLLEYRYLRAYDSREGITDVLRRMDKRTRFPSDFGAGADQLYVAYAKYEEDFDDLFTYLLAEVPRWLREGQRSRSII